MEERPAAKPASLDIKVPVRLQESHLCDLEVITVGDECTTPTLWCCAYCVKHFLSDFESGSTAIRTKIILNELALSISAWCTKTKVSHTAPVAFYEFKVPVLRRINRLHVEVDCLSWLCTCLLKLNSTIC